MDDATMELAKIVLGPLVTAVFAWLVGNRISVSWALRQKHREYSLSVGTEFYQVYGEFFATWKLANYAFRHERPDITDGFIQDLIARSAALEARIEALLLRMASELRHSIIRRQQLDFFGAGQAKYEFYKQLSVAVGDLVRDLGERPRPTRERAVTQMTDITSSKWEAEWLRMFPGPQVAMDQAA